MRRFLGWLADRTKLAVVQISRIERGTREIRLGTLIRLIDGLEIPPEVLLHGLYGQSSED